MLASLIHRTPYTRECAAQCTHSASPEVSRDRGRRDVNFVKFSGRNRRCESHRGALLIPMAAAPASLGAADPPAAQPGFRLDRRVAYFHYDDAGALLAGTGAALAGARGAVDARRFELSHALHESTGLTKYLMRLRPRLLTTRDLSAFHDDRYLQVLREATRFTEAVPGRDRSSGCKDQVSSRAPGWIHAIRQRPLLGGL